MNSCRISSYRMNLSAFAHCRPAIVRLIRRPQLFHPGGSVLGEVELRDSFVVFVSLWVTESVNVGRGSCVQKSCRTNVHFLRNEFCGTELRGGVR